jgi:putative transposase
MERHEMSERRACKAIGCCRMTIRYQSTRSEDSVLRERMIALARERRRFGYRRLHVLLKREGTRSTTRSCSASIGKNG